MIATVGIYSISFRPRDLRAFIDWAAAQRVPSVDLQAGSRGYDFVQSPATDLTAAAEALAQHGIRVELLTTELEIGLISREHEAATSAALGVFADACARFGATGLRIFADLPGGHGWQDDLARLATAYPGIRFAVELHSAWWLESSVLDQLLEVIAGIPNLEVLLDYEQLVRHAPRCADALVGALLPHAQMVHLGVPPTDAPRRAFVGRLVSTPQQFAVHLEHRGAQRDAATVTSTFAAFRRAIADIREAPEIAVR